MIAIPLPKQTENTSSPEHTTDQRRHESRVRANVKDRNTQFLIRMHERDVASSHFGAVHFRVIYHRVMNITHVHKAPYIIIVQWKIVWHLQQRLQI